MQNQQHPGVYVPSQANYQPLNNQYASSPPQQGVPSQFLPPQQSVPYQPTQNVAPSAPQQYSPPPTNYQPVVAGLPVQQQQQTVTPSAAQQQQQSKYVKPYENSQQGIGHTEPALYQALVDTERLIIKQDIEYMEAAANNLANAVNLDALGAFGEQANTYDIFTDDGGKKFRVIETSNYFCRCCLRPNHELQLHVFLPQDTQNQVLVLDRPWKCGHCISVANICQQEMKVYQGDVKPGMDPDPSKMIGVVKQPFMGGMFSPKLNVMDREGGENIATIQAEAKCCIGGMCCDHKFNVKDKAGNYMGRIVKERPGSLAQIAKELTTDADNFTMYFPKDMNVKDKANMLAALHLIDYMFFEDEGDLNVDIRNRNCTYKCCDFYCCGCVLPCKLSCQQCCRSKEEKKQKSYQQSQSVSSGGKGNNKPHHHDHGHHHGPGHHGPGHHHKKHPPHHHPPPHHHHDHHHGPGHHLKKMFH